MPNTHQAIQENTVADAVERVLRDLADPRDLVRTPAEDWKPELWQALADLGLPTLWAPEDRGGLGFPLGDGLAVATVLGRHAIALPIAESMLANWILGAAGLPVASGTAVPVVMQPAGCDQGTENLHSAPALFAAEAQHIVAVRADDRGCNVAMISGAEAEFLDIESVSGDRRAALVLPGGRSVVWHPAPALQVRHVLLLGATLRSLQIAGALESVLAMTLEYAGQRVAFGKTISKFQAVQQLMAQLGGEVAAAIAVAQSAAECIASTEDLSDPSVLLEVASAKIRCGEAAQVASGIAHQIHGAIGFTAEHVLHRFTLRTLDWRDDFGDEAFWAKLLGEFLTSERQTPLWHLLSSR